MRTKSVLLLFPKEYTTSFTSCQVFFFKKLHFFVLRSFVPTPQKNPSPLFGNIQHYSQVSLHDYFCHTVTFFRHFKQFVSLRLIFFLQPINFHENFIPKIVKMNIYKTAMLWYNFTCSHGDGPIHRTGYINARFAVGSGVSSL